MYLLDTHIFYWYITDSDKLGHELESALTSGAFPALVSVVSIWELSIKTARGKLKISILPQFDEKRFLAQYVEHAGFNLLNMSVEHAERIRTLPHIHGDPFDRLLIAQALEENLTLITRDSIVASYPSVKALLV